MSHVIIKRQKIEKHAIIDNLKHLPIIEVACSKAGIARATYYRWRKTDGMFTKLADDAISAGVNYINDLAESKLLSEINGGNLTAILYWLNHRHTAYSNKVEITTNVKQNEKLTPEQQKAVKKALSLTGLVEQDKEK
jgi:hypothetical protein